MYVMKAKYNGTCKVTGKQIVAGKTNITKINGRWQVAPETAKLNNKWVVPGIAGVEVDGPYSGGICEYQGIEVPEWCVVALGQEDGEELKYWTFRDEESAYNCQKLVIANNEFLPALF